MMLDFIYIRDFPFMPVFIYFPPVGYVLSLFKPIRPIGSADSDFEVSALKSERNA